MIPLYLSDLREGLKDERINWLKSEAIKGSQKAKEILKAIDDYDNDITEDLTITIGHYNELDDWKIE